MRPRKLSSVAEVTRGLLAGEDGDVTGVAIDSREVRPGELFVALAGEHADGHDFLGPAFSAGAAGALVEHQGDHAGPVVVVPDTGRALMDLAADERHNLRATVVGITGSTGKTSVKDLTAAVLATRFRVHASPRSFNTEVGVPVTLLSVDDEDDVVVCEMGSRGRGHITLLTEVARPRVGVVTNVGLAHMEMFGSRQAVADGKAELVESLPEDGIAVLNADDPVVRAFHRRTRARVILFGTAAEADVRGEDLALDRDGRPAFTLVTPTGMERVELSVPGEHMAWNALAAAACGIGLGLTAGECAAGLKEARVSPWRMEVLETPGGLRMMNDAYNANPASMTAALRTARVMAGDGRCVAVLGEMAELGSISAEEHARIGELVARLGIERLITVGDAAHVIGIAALREGVEPGLVTRCSTVDEAVEAVLADSRPGDLVLVKASRAIGLERLVERLMDAGNREDAG
ncbi:MAG: UDP-N-acetylmuramoyl-tripeptide--D-alanyl-D-alanine ligase [Actinomycetota bacterium]